MGYTTGDSTTPVIVALGLFGPIGVLQWLGGYELRIFGVVLIAEGLAAAGAGWAGGAVKRRRRQTSAGA